MNCRRHAKLTAAVVGGGALITGGLVSVMLAPVGQAAGPGIYSLETITEETPASTPEIAVATPAIKGPAPLYPGEAPDSNPQ